MKCAFVIVSLIALIRLPVKAQDNTPEYNQAAYRTKREMQLFQLAEWTKKNDPELMDAIKFQMVLSNAKIILDKHAANDPNNVPKNNAEAGEAWALVVENSALLCELLVRFPETTNSILKQPNYSEVVSWALEFLLDTKYPNENDKKLIQYAKYELNLAPRPEGYRSPFSEENQKATKEILRELKRKKAREEVRKQARRPKLSRREEL